MNNQNWIEFNNVKLGYGSDVILSDLNFSLSEGTAVGLVGPNGSGKSTIIKAILGVLKPIKGEINRCKGLAERIGYVPQRSQIDDLFPFTVREIVEMGLYSRLKFWQRFSNAQLELVDKALCTVGLINKADMQFKSLSGGQRQRALVARALVTEPEVLLLDEPTQGLDIAQQETLLELLQSVMSQQGASILMVSHVLSEIITHTRRVLLLHNGKLAFDGSIDENLDEHLSQIYNRTVKVYNYLSGSTTPQNQEVICGNITA